MGKVKHASILAFSFWGLLLALTPWERKLFCYLAASAVRPWYVAIISPRQNVLKCSSHPLGIGTKWVVVESLISFHAHGPQERLFILLTPDCPD